MPDHVHFLLQGKTEFSSSLQVMYKFAQKTGFLLSKRFPQFKWQKDFYDHILRKENDLKRMIEYILLNPVRKEIVKDWREYPFKGSTIYNFDEW
jgi:REP element-mobilizing transposase RayT